MQVALMINTEDDADLARAVGLLELIANTRGSGAAVEGRADVSAVLRGREDDGAPADRAGPDLAEIVRGLADPHRYGEGRLNYLRLVAAAGDQGVDTGEMKDGHFKGDYQAYGGTHSSIEKNWRASGGEVYAPKLIADSSDRQVMYGPARKLILDLLGEDLTGEGEA